MDAQTAERMNTSYPLWACRRLMRTLTRDGVKETASLVRKNLAEYVRTELNRRFDRKYNVDTSGVVQLNDLTSDSGNKSFGVWYEPTPLRTLKCMSSLLPASLGDYTFIDFGSGKGRTLLYASNFGFRRIMGVEFTRELHEVAVRNIRSYRNIAQVCTNIEPLCMDAADFELPDENCVLYFFHPFKEEVMAKVLANIVASYRRRPRKLMLLYYHPQLNEMICESGIVRKTGEVTMPLDLSAEHCIYRRKIERYETDAA